MVEWLPWLQCTHLLGTTIGVRYMWRSGCRGCGWTVAIETVCTGLLGYIGVKYIHMTRCLKCCG